jgi:hypothetical protein
MKAVLCALSAALMIGLTAPAYAQEDGAEPTPAQVRAAAEAFDRGREAYKAEEFVAAAEQFEIADANAPRPNTIELAIRSRDKAGQLDRAATLSALGLARYPDDANVAKVAKPILERAKPELYEVTVRCSAPCDLVAGGKLVHGARSAEHTLYLLPGKQVIRAGFDDKRSVSKTVEAAKGEAIVLDFDEPPAATTPDPGAAPEKDPVLEDPEPKQEKRSGWSPVVFWTGVALTGVAAGVTVWSGIDTQNNPGPDKVREKCAGLGESCAEYQEGLDNQRRTNIMLGVTSAVGVATALVGILATDWSGGSKEAAVSRSQVPRKLNRNVQAVRIQPFVGYENGALIGAFGRF